jgi:hypothetical protein
LHILDLYSCRDVADDYILHSIYSLAFPPAIWEGMVLSDPAMRYLGFSTVRQHDFDPNAEPAQIQR